MKNMATLKYLCKNGKYTLYSNGNKIYVYDKSEGSFRVIGELPLDSKLKPFKSIRMVQRLLRLEPRCAIPADNDTMILSHRGHVYRVVPEKGQIIPEHGFRSDMNNLLSFCKIRQIDGFEDGILYGEYFGNNNREEVSIYHRNKVGEWHKVYSFKAGQIQHIHGLVPHKNWKSVLILTGDKDEESAIWEAKDNFKSVKRLVGGSQRYRSCVAFPCDDGLIFVTDTPLEENALYHLSKKNGEIMIKKIIDISGPSIYGCFGSDGRMVFSTTVEPDSSLKRLRYFFTRKLGAGVEDRYSHVYSGSLEEGFNEIMKGKKDWLPMSLFGFGTFQIPSVSDKGIILTGQSIKRYDGKTIIIK